MRHRIGPGVIDLPSDRPLLVRNAHLFRRLPSIDASHKRAGRGHGAGAPPNGPRTHVDLSLGLGSHGGMVRSRTRASASASTTAERTVAGQNADGTNAVEREVYRAGSCHAPSGPRMMAEPTT